jgi:GDPmannose 4,6-dehydratase
LPPVGAAAGVFVLVGGRIVRFVLGSAYRGQVGQQLGHLVVYLSPWMVGWVGFAVTFPLVFVAGRRRALIPLALAGFALCIPLGLGLRAAAGLSGIAIAIGLATLVIAFGLMAALDAGARGRCGRARARLASRSPLQRLAFGGMALLLPSIPAALLGVVIYALLIFLDPFARSHRGLDIRAGAALSGGRAIVTGASGQDGSYLVELLKGRGYEVVGLDRGDIDLLDSAAVSALLRDAAPSEVYNLASPSFVPRSWDEPVEVAQLGTVGITVLLEAIRAVDPSVRLFQASSAEVFGVPAETPLVETTPSPRVAVRRREGVWHVHRRAYRRRYGLHASAASSSTMSRRGGRLPSAREGGARRSIAAAASASLSWESRCGARWATLDFVEAMWLMRCRKQRRLRDRDGRATHRSRARPARSLTPGSTASMSASTSPSSAARAHTRRRSGKGARTARPKPT